MASFWVIIGYLVNAVISIKVIKSSLSSVTPVEMKTHPEGHVYINLQKPLKLCRQYWIGQVRTYHASAMASH